MRELLQLVERVAPSSMPALVVGETGVGKELVAERLHELSPRRGRPLLKVNCASLAEGLLASELFGHERGAFTGAHAAKPGLFEAADGSTIFLDEVGELPLETQAKLLRVLESGEVLRVGARAPRLVDVRIVSATNRDLAALVSTGKFREDLYYRLDGVTLRVPPLRERPADIVPLAEFFLGRVALTLRIEPPRLTEAARMALLARTWAGNVRQLKHVIERAVVLGQGNVLDAAALGFDRDREPLVSPQLPPDIASRSICSRSAYAGSSERASMLRAELTRTERQCVLDALAQGGNQAKAAALLGISRRALLSRLDVYAIPRPRKGRARLER